MVLVPMPEVYRERAAYVRRRTDGWCAPGYLGV